MTEPQSSQIKPRYVLRATDGRMATYDTATGPSLTSNRALSYVWASAQEAEQQRPLYERAFAVPLSVEPL